MRTGPTAARVFNLHDVEHDIHEALAGAPPLPRREPSDFAPPAIRTPVPPLPSYLEHREGADQIGKLSAEAVGKTYELAAKEIEAMGAELRERARICELMVVESNKALDQITETAAAFRDAGKVVFLQIEDCSLMTKEVRETCEVLKSKIARMST